MTYKYRLCYSFQMYPGLAKILEKLTAPAAAKDAPAEAPYMRLLRSYNQSMGDAITQQALDEVPIAKRQMTEKAIFVHSPFYGISANEIYLPDSETVDRSSFIHFAHEARHYDQLKMVPAFCYRAHLEPERAVFADRVIEVDAYLYESEKAMVDYIKTGNGNDLKLYYMQSESLVVTYASALNNVTGSLGNKNPQDFKAVKKLLDRMPKTFAADPVFANVKAPFCHDFSLQPNLWECYENETATYQEKFYKQVLKLEDPVFSVCASLIGTQPATVTQAEKLLYRHDPDKPYLHRLDQTAQDQFWQNMETLSPAYQERLAGIQATVGQIKERLAGMTA